MIQNITLFSVSNTWLQHELCINVTWIYVKCSISNIISYSAVQSLEQDNYRCWLIELTLFYRFCGMPYEVDPNMICKWCLSKRMKLGMFIILYSCSWYVHYPNKELGIFDHFVTSFAVVFAYICCWNYIYYGFQLCMKLLSTYVTSNMCMKMACEWCLHKCVNHMP